MFRRSFLVLALALVAPQVAQAKGPIAVSVCGADACESIGAPIRGRDPFGGSSEDSVRAAAPGSYYRLVLTSEGETWSIYYVPSAGALAVPYQTWMNWHPLRGVAAARVRRIARRLEPLPAPTVSKALADGRALEGDAGAYLQLLAPSRRIPLPGNVAPVRVELASARPSPWTNLELLYYPDRDLLQRAPSDFVRVPPSFAARLEGTSENAAGSAGRSFPSTASLFGAGAALLLVAAAFAARRFAGRRTRLA